jgi:excinuclease ABC subunit A
MLDKIIVRGAKGHNLKDINVEIPRDSLTVITGPSGSGKSSPASLRGEPFRICPAVP